LGKKTPFRSAAVAWAKVKKTPTAHLKGIQVQNFTFFLRCETLPKLLFFANGCQATFVSVPDFCEIFQKPLHPHELIMSAAGRR
jgi:hypothetical protein